MQLHGHLHFVCRVNDLMEATCLTWFQVKYHPYKRATGRAHTRGTSANTKRSVICRLSSSGSSSKAERPFSLKCLTRSRAVKELKWKSCSKCFSHGYWMLLQAWQPVTPLQKCVWVYRVESNPQHLWGFSEKLELPLSLYFLFRLLDSTGVQVILTGLCEASETTSWHTFCPVSISARCFGWKKAFMGKTEKYKTGWNTLGPNSNDKQSALFTQILSWYIFLEINLPSFHCIGRIGATGCTWQQFESGMWKLDKKWIWFNI